MMGGIEGGDESTEAMWLSVVLFILTVAVVGSIVVLRWIKGVGQNSAVETEERQARYGRGTELGRRIRTAHTAMASVAMACPYIHARPPHHTPHVTHHTPHATRHTPHATRHTPHATASISKTIVESVHGV